MRVSITRYGSSPAGTPGTLTISDDQSLSVSFSCYCVEQPWVFNIPSRSCIPIGEYTLKLDRFNKGGYDAYKVESVPGRSEIKIHVGNDITDIEGCIVLGKNLGIQAGLWFVGSSKIAFGEFMIAMDKARLAVLEVRNAYPIQEGELWEIK